MKTRYAELGYRRGGPTLWRIYCTQSEGAEVGPLYRSKAELLADLGNFAAEFGCADATKAEEAKVLGLGDTDIFAYRTDLETELAAALEGTEYEGETLDLGDWAASRFLSVEVWTSDLQPDCPRVEILLTCGGPTVRLTYDHGNESAELYHSWGKTPHGEERHTVEFKGALVLQVLEALGVIE